MEAVIAFLAFWLLVAVIVIIQAAIVAIGVYFIILLILWLFEKMREGREKYRGN